MQKLYYSISEVSKMVDEEQHILRYWEKEFSEINPRKNRAGNRVYSLRDLAVVKYVKMMLRDEKLSLKGAKEKIKHIDPVTFDSFLKVEKQEVSPASESTVPVTNTKPNGTGVMNVAALIELKQLLTDVRTYLLASAK
ncbi:MAG: MerR family transcriptional regulator [Candidatus Kapabacteria bacterium]|nr:MerR family transcriptional regulator [Candidatus Kapabacteria bacterium]